PKDKSRKKKNHSNTLNDLILIDKVLVNKAQYFLKDPSGKHNKLTVNDFNLTLNDIRVDDKTVIEKIPFTYKNPQLSTGKVRFDSGKTYVISSAGMVLNESKSEERRVGKECRYR